MRPNNYLIRARAESVCLVVYVANGHIMAFSLPSLKPLLDNDYLPFPDVRSATLRSLCVIQFIVAYLLLLASKDSLPR